MSTRATIGMTLPNEMIVCVYCYHDATPNYLGQILTKNYDTEEKIKELMKGGHLDEIAAKPKKCNYEHQGGEPVAEDCRPVTRRNLGEFLQKVKDFGHDYGYIFRDGQWHVYNPYE